MGMSGYLAPWGQSGTSWVCDAGLSYVFRDVPSCLRTNHGSTGHPSDLSLLLLLEPEREGSTNELPVIISVFRQKVLLREKPQYQNVADLQHSDLRGYLTDT